MKRLSYAHRAAMLLAFTATASTCTSAATQHQLAYTDAIAQQGVAPMRLSGMVAMSGPSTTDASAVTALAKMVFLQTMTLKIEGKAQPVILRRSFPAGDGGTTGPTDVLFSIQACRNVERDSQDTNRASCRDQPAAAPMFVFGRLTMAPGGSATATFPGGIVWTYQVRDPDTTTFAR